MKSQAITEQRNDEQDRKNGDRSGQAEDGNLTESGESRKERITPNAKGAKKAKMKGPVSAPYGGVQ